MAMLSRHKLSVVAFLTATAIGAVGIPFGFAADKNKTLPAHYWRGGYFGPTFSLTKFKNSYNPAVPVTAQKLKANGKLIGLIGGYNFLTRDFMYGIEGDISNGSVFNEDLSFITTLRGRIGKPMNSSLPFVTGGLAIAGARKSAATPPLTVSNPQFGLVVGAGFEHILARAITGRLEYTYGHFFSNGASNAPRVRLNNVHMLRASVAIHFRD